MKTLVIAFFALAPALAFGAIKDDFQKVDKDLQTCLDNPENGSTYGMNTCLDQAYQAGDKILNRWYRETVKGLKVKTGDNYTDESNHEIYVRLVNSQRAWVKFRDTNSTLAGIDNLGGSAESQSVIYSLYDMTKKRALELESTVSR